MFRIYKPRTVYFICTAVSKSKTTAAQTRNYPLFAQTLIAHQFFMFIFFYSICITVSLSNAACDRPRREEIIHFVLLQEMFRLEHRSVIFLHFLKFYIQFCQSVCLSFSLSLSLYVSISFSLTHSLSLSISLVSIYLSSICLSIYLPIYLSFTHENKRYEIKDQQNILQVTRILLLWVNNHFTDFELDSEMMDLLNMFEHKLEGNNAIIVRSVVCFTLFVLKRPWLNALLEECNHKPSCQSVGWSIGWLPCQE